MSARPRPRRPSPAAPAMAARAAAAVVARAVAALALAVAAVATLATATAVLAPARAAAHRHHLDPSRLEFERTIDDVNAPGLYRADVDPVLYRHARVAALGDVRIVGPDGAEVPWLLRPVPPRQRSVEHAPAHLELLDGGAGGAVLDLGPAPVTHSEVQLTIAGPPNWWRRTAVATSDDGARWTRLSFGAFLFRADAGGHVTEQTTLSYPPSTARLVRVILEPNDGPPVRVTGAVARFVPPEAHVPLRLLATVTPTPVPLPGDAHVSDFVFDLGAGGVPVAELALDIADPAFERRALLASGDGRSSWRPLVATLLYRVAADEAGREAQENVRIGAAGARDRYLRLTVFNGSEAPLVVRAASPAYVAEELVFRAAAAGSYTLYVGGNLPPPRYALAAELARTGEQPTRVAVLGSIAPNPAFGHLRPTAAAAPPPAQGAGGALPWVLALAVVALAVVAVAAVRRRRDTGA